MNTVTAIASVITDGNDALKRAFPLKPLAIREPARRIVHFVRARQEKSS